MIFEFLNGSIQTSYGQFNRALISKVSIPQWFDSDYVGQIQIDDDGKFQFLKGSIQTRNTQFVGIL